MGSLRVAERRQGAGKRWSRSHTEAAARQVIDPAVGFVVTARPGDRVRRGEPLASIFARDGAGVVEGRAALEEAIVLGSGPPPLPLVGARVASAEPASC